MGAGNAVEANSFTTGGFAIIRPAPVPTPIYKFGANHIKLSGTSMATPVVSGAARKESGEMIEVIVQFVDHALEKKERKVEDAFTKAGGKRVGDLNLIGAEIYLLPAKAIEGLLKTPNVRYVSPNRGIKPKLDSSIPPV